MALIHSMFFKKEDNNNIVLMRYRIFKLHFFSCVGCSELNWKVDKQCVCQCNCYYHEQFLGVAVNAMKGNHKKEQRKKEKSETTA